MGRLWPLDVIAATAVCLVVSSSCRTSSGSTLSPRAGNPAESPAGSQPNGPAANVTNATQVSIAEADALKVEGTWDVTEQSAETTRDRTTSGNSQYSRRVRIDKSGSIFRIDRTELKDKVVMLEESTASGWVRQLDRESVRMKWGYDPFIYRIAARDAGSFVLVRDWAIEGPSAIERSRAPLPRPPAGDRSFTDTMTFRRRK